MTRVRFGESPTEAVLRHRGYAEIERSAVRDVTATCALLERAGINVLYIDPTVPCFAPMVEAFPWGVPHAPEWVLAVVAEFDRAGWGGSRLLARLRATNQNEAMQRAVMAAHRLGGLPGVGAVLLSIGKQ